VSQRAPRAPSRVPRPPEAATLAAVRPVPTLAALAAALGARGLALRGAFHPDAARDAIRLPDGRSAGTVALAGQAGPASWERFTRERRDEPDPLDTWAARALDAVADAAGAHVVLPQEGPPFAPFQQWARRAEPVFPSPLGVLIHPEYGLWHAYRGALLFAERLALAPEATPRGVDLESPCAACPSRPCLSACPVGAYAPPLPDGTVRYDDAVCAAHVASPAGAACREGGCLARQACPVGRAHAYGADQQRFHLAAFLRARRR
jgi:hypothetical protein